MKNWDWTWRLRLIRVMVRLVRCIKRSQMDGLKGKNHKKFLWIILGLLLFCVGCILTWVLKEDPDDSVIDEVQRGWFLLGRQGRYEEGVQRCSWMYLDVDLEGTGKSADEFSKGGGLLEEYLRAEQSKSRAFCVTILATEERNRGTMEMVRRRIGHKFRSFNVYKDLRVGDTEGETVEVEGTGPKAKQKSVMKTVYLPTLVESLTPERKDSGRDTWGMVLALSNRNNGTAVVRITSSVADAYRMLEDLAKSNILCSRVDRLVLNISEHAPNTYIHLRKRPSSSNIWNPKNGVRGLAYLARRINDEDNKCRAMIYVLSNGERIVPSSLTKDEVFYAVLAGAPTFNRRVAAQTSSWMQDVPRNKLALFTDFERVGKDRKAANGFDISVVQPSNMTMEQWPRRMQSWSHLVRIREAWDRYVSKDKDIKWLMLVDDDTFVFTEALREYLTGMDHRVLQWGGSAEQARIDNGDAGIFAHWLRNASQVYGGKYCYMRNEHVSRGLRMPRLIYKKHASVKNMILVKKQSIWCHDTFCRKGCPSVPQGAAVFVSRPVVEQLRPQIEECERLTHTLCKSCGSQRLYMCIHLFLKQTRTLMARGICRSTWKIEHRTQFPFALTYHGFERYRGRAFHKGSIMNDMQELYEIGKREERISEKKGGSIVRMQSIADAIGCDGEGHYDMEINECIPFKQSEEE